jgi:hypothetical protein
VAWWMCVMGIPANRQFKTSRPDARHSIAASPFADHQKQTRQTPWDTAMPSDLRKSGLLP